MWIDTNQKCLDVLTYETEGGQTRRISKQYKKYSSIFVVSKIKCD